MLPEVGGLEYVVIAVVALIVVGPKDLPKMLHKLGQFVGKLRGMAAEFRASFDEMARQSELDDLRKEVEAMRKGQILDQAAHDATNVEVSQIFNEIGESLNGTGGSYAPTPMTLAQTAEIETPEPTVVEAKPQARRKASEGTVVDARKPRAKAAAPKAPAPKTTKAAAAKSVAPKKVAAKVPAKRAAKPKAGTVS